MRYRRNATPCQAVSILIFNKGAVLTIQHPDGTISIPGGKLEPGETLEQGVVRELYEETGCIVRPETLALVDIIETPDIITGGCAAFVGKIGNQTPISVELNRIPEWIPIGQFLTDPRLRYQNWYQILFDLVVPKNIIFIGAPGVGKGTQAKLLSQTLNISHISTGDLLRSEVKAGTELGQQVGPYMKRGEMYPDISPTMNLFLATLKHKLFNGFILDGFPRSLVQAQLLNKLLTTMNLRIDCVIYLSSDDATIISRLLNRGRPDDSAEIIKTRLRIFQSETLPVLSFYKSRVIEVSGIGTVEEVHLAILTALGLA